MNKAAHERLYFCLRLARSGAQARFYSPVVYKSEISAAAWP